MMRLYGIKDAMSLPGPKFFRLAYRVPCYTLFTPDGVPYGTVMATRLAAEMDAEGGPQEVAKRRDDEPREIPLDSPELAGLVEIVRAP